MRKFGWFVLLVLLAMSCAPLVRAAGGEATPQQMVIGLYMSGQIDAATTTEAMTAVELPTPPTVAFWVAPTGGAGFWWIIPGDPGDWVYLGKNAPPFNPWLDGYFADEDGEWVWISPT